jgi:hypothetical protein
MTLARQMGAVEDAISVLLRDTDCSSNTLVAIKYLARAFDTHAQHCPHVEPPVARPNLTQFIERQEARG